MVTFGGADFDRAAHLRFEDREIASFLAHGGACVLPVWRGKILVEISGKPQLAYLPHDNPIFHDLVERPVFLGLDADRPVFAADVSAWEPPVSAERPEDGVFFDPSLQPLPGSKGVFAELRGVMAQLSNTEAEVAATGLSILNWQKSHRFCSSCGHESHVIMAGWQRKCPECGTHHFPRTDPVVIMLVTRGNSVLVGRSPGWPEGMYSLLAGFVEPGETLEAAVRREVFEECGIRTGAVEYLASQPWPYPSSLMIGCQTRAFAGAIKRDPKEIEDALWVSREEMMSVFAGQSATMSPPRQGAIAQFLLKNWLADQLE